MVLVVVIDQCEKRTITDHFDQNDRTLTYLDCSNSKSFNQIPNNLLQLEEIRVSEITEIPETLFNITKIIFNTGKINTDVILLSESSATLYEFNNEFSECNDESENKINKDCEESFYNQRFESDFVITLRSDIQFYNTSNFADYYDYDDNYDYNFDGYDSDIHPYDSDADSNASFDSFDTTCDKRYNKFYQVLTIRHQSKLDELNNKIVKFNRTKQGLIKFVKLYKYYKLFKTLWKIAEYYSKIKYMPIHIFKYVNLDD